MKARLVRFGELEIDGQRYDHDVVIERGQVTRRKKGPSKPYRDEYGHTPLSADERIPWSGHRLIVGTGADGQLPIMPELRAAATKRGVEIVEMPTADACRMLADLDDDEIAAILHVTC